MSVAWFSLWCVAAPSSLAICVLTVLHTDCILGRVTLPPACNWEKGEGESTGVCVGGGGGGERKRKVSLTAILQTIQ